MGEGKQQLWGIKSRETSDMDKRKPIEHKIWIKYRVEKSCPFSVVGIHLHVCELLPLHAAFSVSPLQT
jgi:hypothetical protein